AAAWGQLGMVLFIHHLAEEAAACLRQAEQLDRADARWPYFQGLLALRNHSPDDAIAAFRKALDAAEPATSGPLRLRLAGTLQGGSRAPAGRPPGLPGARLGPDEPAPPRRGRDRFPPGRPRVSGFRKGLVGPGLGPGLRQRPRRRRGLAGQGAGAERG